MKVFPTLAVAAIGISVALLTKHAANDGALDKRQTWNCEGYDCSDKVIRSDKVIQKPNGGAVDNLYLGKRAAAGGWPPRELRIYSEYPGAAPAIRIRPMSAEEWAKTCAVLQSHPIGLRCAEDPFIVQTRPFKGGI